MKKSTLCWEDNIYEVKSIIIAQTMEGGMAYTIVSCFHYKESRLWEIVDANCYIRDTTWKSQLRSIANRPIVNTNHKQH